MTPLVSIIITAYNQESFVAQAIQSVVNQTYENWECIIIDDGSTDKTCEICKHFIQKESRISYFFQQNQGVSIARNNGFEK
jgi:glycosyltransferase involved in cell wall biosynthesis